MSQNTKYKLSDETFCCISIFYKSSTNISTCTVLFKSSPNISLNKHPISTQGAFLKIGLPARRSAYSRGGLSLKI